MTNTYAKAYTEVLEIIKHFSDEEYSRIAREKIEYYERNRDKDYVFKLDPKIDLFEQKISRKANAIIVALYRDYFASEAEKQQMNRLLNINQHRLEEEKKERYNSEDLFEDEQEADKQEEKQELALVIVKNDSLYEKIVVFLKRVFKN